ncbi:hypothetical protein Pmani_037094 [Petrolisthes manimaculis]|uniref:Uncharacterized protein n=1 Tax=Petrolisthes manimaculis TaxID=1843537 RepID=A0AAE1NIE1_9EUCA|nr:hypothetical protein Pmani_037094 [Petrolisthes manimaculis]
MSLFLSHPSYMQNPHFNSGHSAEKEGGKEEGRGSMLGRRSAFVMRILAGLIICVALAAAIPEPQGGGLFRVRGASCGILALSGSLTHSLTRSFTLTSLTDCFPMSVTPSCLSLVASPLCPLLTTLFTLSHTHLSLSGLYLSFRFHFTTLTLTHSLTHPSSVPFPSQ